MSTHAYPGTDAARVRQLEIDNALASQAQAQMQSRLDRIESILIVVAGTSILTLAGGLGTVWWAFFNLHLQIAHA